MHFSRILGLSSFLSLGSALAINNGSPTSRSISKRTGGGDCVNGAWAPVQFIGGDRGLSFCETSWGNYLVPLAGFEVWTVADGGHIAGIQGIYADGNRGMVFGTPEATTSHPPKTFMLAPGELITSFISYGDGSANFAGAVHVETDNGNTFDAGRNTDGIHPYPQELGSSGKGLLYGFTGQQDGTGNHDGGIVSLAWLFLRDGVKHVTVSDVQYDTNALKAASQLKPNTINMGTYYNHLNSSVVVAQEQSSKVINTNTWSQTATNQFSVTKDITVSAQPLGMGVSSKTEFGFTRTDETSSGGSTANEMALVCKLNEATLGPKQGVEITGTFANGTTTIPYDSKVDIELNDGFKFSYREAGELQSVQYSACHTDVKPSDDSFGDQPPQTPVKTDIDWSKIQH